MTFNDDVLPTETILLNIINKIQSLGRATETGFVGDVTVDKVATKIDLASQKNAFVVASNNYKTAAVAWFNGLP